MVLDFEWHDAKAEANCELTASASSWQRQSSKTRSPSNFLMIVRTTAKIGTSAEAQVLLFLAYAEREERVRIISARRATRDEQEHYFKTNA